MIYPNFSQKKCKKNVFFTNFAQNQHKTNTNYSKIMEKVEIINAMLSELKKRGLWQQYKDVADRLGMNRATVSSAVHGHPNGCTQSFIFKLNEGYGSLFNPEWLISGNGYMLLSDAEAAAATAPGISIQQQNAKDCTASVNQSPDVAVQLLQMQVETLRKDNERLESEKKRLEEKNEELLQIILNKK